MFDLRMTDSARSIKSIEDYLNYARSVRIRVRVLGLGSHIVLVHLV